jgi:hypothetical protein
MLQITIVNYQQVYERVKSKEKMNLRNNRQLCSPLEPHDFHHNCHTRRKSLGRHDRTLLIQFPQRALTRLERR